MGAIQKELEKEERELEKNKKEKKRIWRGTVKSRKIEEGKEEKTRKIRCGIMYGNKVILYEANMKEEREMWNGKQISNELIRTIRRYEKDIIEILNILDVRVRIQYQTKVKGIERLGVWLEWIRKKIGDRLEPVNITKEIEELGKKKYKTYEEEMEGEEWKE